ncbi:DUF4349 domain-containing protein [Streptomyces sp. BV129]|uniref:DUF4349 domain-containing protein n=1 Tax=Streptomyces sp. BV129 TaxID=2849671 RepID=UPI001C2E4218|nr:DUF4349 domain-containing protein [Streptomyces sp. BV129]MBV1948023.1 DUF4349 domain-containing protein [Streptomyces sp. BV129]
MRTTRQFRVLAGVLLAASLALAGCGASGGGDSKASSADVPTAAPGAGGSAAEDAKSSRRSPRLAPSVIRTASLEVEVRDVPGALAKARRVTEDAGGYVGEESTERDDDSGERTRVVLRVPAERYEEVLGSLQGTGKLLRRTARAQDVTDQVVDVDSRIKSQRASVARVRELMDRAEKLTDVVALEGELSGREADLEALLARQASLKDRTGLATITLSLSGKGAHADAGDDTPGLLDALSGGWHAFWTMLRWIALAVGAVLPFAVLLALLVFLWRRVVRPRFARDPRPAPTAPSGSLPQARPVSESGAPVSGDES